VEFKISTARAGRLEEERLAQQAWVLKQPALAPVIEGYLRREFLEPQAARDLEAMELQRIIGFARSRVPYYRDSDVWRAAHLEGPVDREMLATLPIVTKTQLREEFDSLRTLRLPKGERILYETKSSGTSGTPARVLYSQRAGMAFGLLAQRPHRWGRLDPHTKLAAIRQARVLPKGSDALPLKEGATLRLNGWMYVRDYFHTGPQVSATRGNPLEFLLEWLRAERPVHLLTSPSLLESLVYAAQGKPVDSLRGLRAVAATLTEAVRHQIESATGLPIQQPYGLNEIGAVAHRCAAGRYHVNAEHCVVEIVDENHQPCKPGEFGHVLVTGLTNVAMPLIRYDTGDLAEAVSGECPCGRTLPTFGRILGRYRPMGHAPAGTTRRMDLVFAVLRSLPLDILRDLREYQLHQYLDGNFELRLATRGEPDPRLIMAVREAWDRQAEGVTLNVIQVNAIARIPGRKTQDFTSDYFPTIPAGA
jgi:phenylacetate-CoA ligase